MLSSIRLKSTPDEHSTYAQSLCTHLLYSNHARKSTEHRLRFGSSAPAHPDKPPYLTYISNLRIMQGTRGRLAQALLLIACTTFLLAHAAHAPTTGMLPHKARTRFSRLKARKIVTPEAEDTIYENSVLGEDTAGVNTDNGQQGTLGQSQDAEVSATKTLSQEAGVSATTTVSQEAGVSATTTVSLDGSLQNSIPTEDEECEVSSFSSGDSTGGAAPGEGGTVAAWMRPDRLSFDGDQAPFAVANGDDITWFKIGEENGATTIAAQQVKEITDYKGKVVTATIGDVMIFQDGAVAEAIGSILPDGRQGEMYDIIACNVQSDSGKCIMVDYDGTEVKSTVSKTIAGKTQTIAIGAPTVIPAALNTWAANVMVLDVSTVTAKPVVKRQRGRRL